MLNCQMISSSHFSSTMNHSRLTSPAASQIPSALSLAKSRCFLFLWIYHSKQQRPGRGSGCLVTAHVHVGEFEHE